MKKTKEIGGNDSSWSNVGRCPRFKDAVDHSPPDLARDQFQVIHLSDRKKIATKEYVLAPHCHFLPLQKIKITFEFIFISFIFIQNIFQQDLDIFEIREDLVIFVNFDKILIKIVSKFIHFIDFENFIIYYKLW